MGKNNNKNTRQSPTSNGRSTGRAGNLLQIRGGRSIPTLGMGRQLQFGFPKQMLTKLRYYDTYAMTVTTGSLGKQVMRWNSTFDPDYSGVGHQPLYRDTFAGVFDHYAVVSATANVKIINTSTVPIICGVVTDDDATSAGVVTVLCEQTTGQHCLLPPVSGSLSSVTFNPTWSCKADLGIDPYSSEEYKTTVGSNPTEESYLHVWATVTDGASSTSVIVSLEIVQTILWTELATPSSS